VPTAKRAEMDTITLMQTTCKGISELTGTDDWGTWTANCGRIVSKKHGPHQVAKDMRIAAPRSRGTMAMTRGAANVAMGSKYSMLRVTHKTRVAVAKFEALGEVASQALAPTTVTEWNEQFDKIVEKCAGVPGVGHGHITSPGSMEITRGLLCFGNCSKQKHTRTTTHHDEHIVFYFIEFVFYTSNRLY
jgi:hypothetical protein